MVAAVKALRLRRLFGSDGRSLIVALDRPRALFTPSLRDHGSVIHVSEAEGADAVIVSPGTAVEFAARFGELGVILSIRGDRTTAAARLEAAMRLGVDAIKYEAFPGGPDGAATIEVLDFLGARCAAAGLPLLAEVVPVSFDARESHTGDAVAHAARVGQECGADLVKVPPPVDGQLGAVVGYVGIPVLVLGGPAKDLGDLVSSVAAAVDAGASGAAVGRNVFEAADPAAAVRALAEAVHQRKSPDA